MAADLLATPERNHRGYPPDTQTLTDHRVRVGIELENQGSAGVSVSELVQRGGHGAAGSAPVGVAIEHDGHAGTGDDAVEVRIGHFDRAVEPNGPAALSALRTTVEPLEVDPVEHRTEGTGDGDGALGFDRRAHASV